MKVNLQFNNSTRSNLCEISRDLFEEYEGCKGYKYAAIQLATYDSSIPKTVFSECTLNETLLFGTIKAPRKLFHVYSMGPTASSCDFEPLKRKPPTLESVTILLKAQLYSKLIQLAAGNERLQFLELKYGLQRLRTVVYEGYIVEPSWCAVSYCAPYSEGLIDFNETEVILLRDDEDTLGDEECNINSKYTSTICDTNQKRLKLLGLKRPVPHELITPVPSSEDDDSLFVFADFQTLLFLGVTSGSYVKISSDSASRVVKIFILTSPHEFESFAIYSPPRILARFAENHEVSVTKYPINELEVPTASSVSIARVGSWNQAQKGYQNIILHNLKCFFTSKQRILLVGDMIPISFDSNLAALYTEDFSAGQLNSHDDSLVWFYVESVEFDEADDETCDESEFIIDPTKTKLITANIVIQEPLKTSRCDYISYYGLNSIFEYDLSKFPYAKKLTEILNSSLHCTSMGIDASTTIILHSTSSNTGKSTLVRFVASKMGFHLLDVDCLSLTTNVGSQDATTKIIGYLRGKIESVLAHTKPAIIYLSHLDVLMVKGDQGQDPEGAKASMSMDLELGKLINEFTTRFKGTVFIGSASDIDSISSNVRNHIKFELSVPVPDEPQRNALFKWFLSPAQLNRDINGDERGYAVKGDVSFSKLSLQSAGLTPLDIKMIVDTARFKCAERIRECDDDPLFSKSLLIINMSDLTDAISKARDDFSVSIGAPKIPNVTWKDIGGMDLVKEEIMDTIDMPLKHPELFASGMKKRSGVLFYGPPGTGKTLMAKAIATNFSLNFFSVKGPELLNMYIGESEANVRRVFQKARDAKPCVIFFDELDSVAPKRGNQGDSGGVMDRIVSQLLAELDGMGSSGEGVFVIGATNRPDLLDEALLRPGRFDKLLYLGISDTNEKQLNILKALTRKFVLDIDVNLTVLAEKCPFNYTGADFYALCSDAMLNAMTRTAGEIDQKVKQYNKTNSLVLSVRQWFDKVATQQDIEVTVKMEDFLKAQLEMSASVSHDELEHYLKVKANFESAS